MKLSEKFTSLFSEKKLTPAEIAENIKEVEEYLKNISPELLTEYKKVTGKNEIKIFSRNNIDDKKMRHSSNLIAYITEDNKINLKLANWGQYEGGSYTHINIWDKNLQKVDYDSNIVLSTEDSRGNISGQKKDIFKLEKKIHDKIRNKKIITPVKNAIKDVFSKIKPKKNIPETV